MFKIINLFLVIVLASPGFSIAQSYSISAAKVSVPINESFSFNIVAIDSNFVSRYYNFTDRTITLLSIALNDKEYIFAGKQGAGVDCEYGKFTPSMDGSFFYKAPGKVPSKNPVAASISFLDEKKQKIIVISTITVTSCKNSLRMNDGPLMCFDKIGTNIQSSPQLGTAVYLTSKGFTMGSFVGIDKQNKYYSVGFNFKGKQKGSYSWDMKACPCNESNQVNDKANKASFSITNLGQNSDAFTSFACTDCDDPDKCAIVPLSGTVWILEYGPVGGKIKGFFIGKLIQNLKEGDPITVECQFELNRIADISNQ